MVFSVSSYSKYKKESSVGEIKIFNFFDALKLKAPSKRLNFPANSDLNLVSSIADDYTIRCETLADLKKLRNANFNAYFSSPATDWEFFYQLLDLGVSDIYIDGPLCFQMDKIALAKGSTKIRVSPNVSPNTLLTRGKPNNFFIRPEDLKLYSAIDVVDFNEKNLEKEEVLFSIYNRGSFRFPLNNLITNFPYEVSNLLFKEDFAEARLNCGQRCKTPGKSCHICESYLETLVFSERFSSLNDA